MKSSGFGLVETAVSVGIIGVIVWGLISQQRLSTKGILNSSSETEINNVTKRVFGEVGLLSVCSLPENFGNKAVARTLTSLQNTSGALTTANTIIKVGDIYGKGAGQVQISKLESYYRTGETGSQTEMVLAIYFQKNDQNLLSKFTTPAVKREIPLNIIVDTAVTPNVVTSCYGNYDLIVKTAIELACVGRGAFYDATVNLPYGECKHNHTNTVNPCTNGMFLKRMDSPATGAVGSEKASGAVTYTCASLENACPNNKFITGFNSDGSVICDLAYKECAPGSILYKLASGQFVCSTLNCPGVTAFSGKFDPTTGVPICNRIPTAKTCDPGNFANIYNTDGSVECNSATVMAWTCKLNEFVSGIGADGYPICTPFIQLPASCPGGQAISGVNSDGSIRCKPIQRQLSCNGATPAGANGYHTYAQCGTVKNPGTASSHCEFSGSTCPAGWTRCNLNGYQTAVSCLDTSNTYYCDGYRQWRTAGTTGYQDANVASTTCYQQTGAPNTNKACSLVATHTITSQQNTVGCF
nr:type II secretion system GspH family protein [Bacteriovorax sp. HI3]